MCFNKCTLVRQKLPLLGCTDSFTLRFFEAMTTFNQLSTGLLGRDLVPNHQHIIEQFKLKVVGFYRESLSIGKI